MALKTNTVVTRIDDYDGGTGDDVKTRRFTFDVEMELSDANFAAVNAQLTAILGKARKPGRKPGGRPGKRIAAADMPR